VAAIVRLENLISYLEQKADTSGVDKIQAYRAQYGI